MLLFPDTDNSSSLNLSLMVFAYPIISASFKWILRFLKIIYINLLGALLSLRNGEIQLYNDFLISDLVFFEMIWFFVVPL